MIKRIKKVDLLCLGAIYFPEKLDDKGIDNNLIMFGKNYKYSYNFFKENLEIDFIELVPLKINSENGATLEINNDKFEIFFKINNQQINKFQDKFSPSKKVLNPNTKKKKKIMECEMTITFNISDIEFMFYQSDFKAVVNGDEWPELYIYLKKLCYECLIVRKNSDKKEEIIFPLFPFVSTENQIENLKFHDIVVQMKIENKDLFDLIIKYEAKFKIVKDINLNNNNNNERNFGEENIEDYETNIPLNTNKLDVIWLLLCLVSEKFISFYTLIRLVNKNQKKLEGLIEEDVYRFIIFLHDILESRYKLDNRNIKFYNDDSFLECYNNFPKELNEEQKKKYKEIQSYYEDNKIKEKYYNFEWIITPMACYFKIPFLKKGMYIIDRYIENKPNDFIFLCFKDYKRIKKIANNKENNVIESLIYNYYIYDIISKSHSFGELDFEYLASTADNMKFKKCWFINSDKVGNFKNFKKIHEINRITEDFYVNELLLSHDEVAFLCPYKSIKKLKNNSLNVNSSIDISMNLSITKYINSIEMKNSGIISKSLYNIIKEKCKIHSFNSCFAIINGFFGNFSICDNEYLNIKNRIVIREDINTQKYKKTERDNRLYILKIFRYSKGIIDNEYIKLLYYTKKNQENNFIEKCIKNSLDLSINSLYNKIPIDKLKYFLKILEEKEKHIFIKENFCNKFLFQIKKAINSYQYKLLINNIIEIPDSAILSGIIDEYNIMETVYDVSNYIFLILNNEKYKNKIIQGNGIIFKARTNYINDKFKPCLIKFFDIDKFENCYINNIEKRIKIRKIKELTNVIIFPKNSLNLFKDLAIENISQQEYFITWNKEIVDNFENIENKNKDFCNNNDSNVKEGIYEEEEQEEEKTLSNEDIKKLFVKNDYWKIKGFNVLRKYINNLNIKAHELYISNLTQLSETKIKINKIDYKNITEILYEGKKMNLNELELFYLEFIPKCTSAIIKFINELKLLIYKYSASNLIDLLIGNIDIKINSKYYNDEIDNINNKIQDIFIDILGNLINSFKFLQNQEINKMEYLSKYKDRMFIISTIIYNICYYPKIIEGIICNYSKLIKKKIRKLTKSDEDKLKEKKTNIQINDCYDIEIDNLGIDYYKLFETDTLINNSLKDNNLEYSNNSDGNKDDIYENFFEDFKMLMFYNKEIQNYYVPELLFFKYLSKLII